MVDEKPGPVLRIRNGRLFAHFADARKPGPSLQHGAQFPVLLRRTHGKYFHTAVAKISHEAADAQFFRGSQRVITVAHALTIPDTKYRLACFVSLTEPRNCNRDFLFLPGLGWSRTLAPRQGCDKLLFRANREAALRGFGASKNL